MKKHGPDLRRARIPLEACSVCKGRAVVDGVFYEMECSNCNASGWVRADGGEALDCRELVTQLGFNLRQARLQLQHLLAQTQQHEKNNRRGAGGSHYTGD